VNVLVLGPQGSGKGTQASRLADRHGIVHVSTGDMFRAAIASGSDLGGRVEPILTAGELVPDELTVALIEERLGERDAASGFVLDGFPRTLAQADALDRMLEAIGRSLDLVLFFELDDEIAAARILGRAHVEGRPDDTPETVARRLAIYHEQTEPVVEQYRARGSLVPLHAERTVGEVQAEIDAAIAVLEATRK
jgi:adenylate kinase